MTDERHEPDTEAGVPADLLDLYVQLDLAAQNAGHAPGTPEHAAAVDELLEAMRALGGDG